MKNVLVLVFTNLKHDARVVRQIGWLRKKHRVTVVCFDAERDTADEIIKIKQTQLNPIRKAALAMALLSRQYSTAFNLFHNYGQTIKELKKRNWDIVVANDIDTLPVAFDVKGNGKVIFDAHEYAPRHFENNRIWKIFFQPFYLHLCQKYIPLVHRMLTVGKGLADEYHKNFGVLPVIITNATKYYEGVPSSVEPDKIKLIHHGIANTSRKLELMIDMMNLLDERFSLDLILMTSDFASAQTKAYIESLKQKATKNGRIKILPAVKSSEVVGTIKQYDMGVFIIPPINFNYANTLPNKLFEFIQARLGIAIGPTPEMAAIVNQYKIGVVSEDFTAENLAKKLNSLSQHDVAAFKINARNAAVVLNAERNEEMFNRLIESLG
jgi:hypothetical protein